MSTYQILSTPSVNISVSAGNEGISPVPDYIHIILMDKGIMKDISMNFQQGKALCRMLNDLLEWVQEQEK